MKQQKTRELLVTTKAARKWDNNFEQKVDELITIVSKLDTESSVRTATETMDVYQHNTSKPKARRRKLPAQERPFAFLVFRN